MLDRFSKAFMHVSIPSSQSILRYKEEIVIVIKKSKTIFDMASMLMKVSRIQELDLLMARSRKLSIYSKRLAVHHSHLLQVGRIGTFGETIKYCSSF